MTNHQIREQLVMKPVGLEYLEQFNQLLRYVFQVTNKDLVSGGYEEGEIIRSKHPVMKKAEIWGWFNENQLVSQVCIYPCQVNIHGKVFNMGGLTGVGTYPEYAGMGLMNDLIKVALEKMREQGQWISYLYPYSIPYYRKKGWEIMSEQLTFVVKDSQLPHYGDAPGFVERLQVDDPDVLSTYDRFARLNHGAMIRHELEWEEYWRWDNEEEYTAAIYYNSSDNPMGYLMYRIADDIFHVKEMLYLDQEARRGLWNFISAHFSMIEEVRGNMFRHDPIAFTLQDSQIEENIAPYFMARIVDVEAFLRHYPFEPARQNAFHFVISDPIAPWNQGIFGLQWDTQGLLRVGQEAVGQPVHTDIQTLSSMLMCFRRPTYFHQIERIDTNTHTLKLLEKTIPNQQPYFSDYF